MRRRQWCQQCHHAVDQHTHWRRGRDCGVCGRDRCPEFRPVPLLRWWLNGRRG